MTDELLHPHAALILALRELIRLRDVAKADCTLYKNGEKNERQAQKTLRQYWHMAENLDLEELLKALEAKA